jgi:hypothetical protein
MTFKKYDKDLDISTNITFKTSSFYNINTIVNLSLELHLSFYTNQRFFTMIENIYVFKVA